MHQDEDIVITGVAGRFPECDNFQKFQEALLAGVDLITEDDRRFPPGLWGTPRRAGKINDLDKFDAGYFGIHAKQAEFMDPRQRILNEVIYEAMVDAGYNPQELKGSKTGVYVGLSGFNNMEEVRKRKSDGYVNIGLSAALAANRASYCFDLKGPSVSMDTACSSSMYAFVNAINDIKMGYSDSAFICSAVINIHPHETMEFNNLNMLAEDGKCKVFSTLRDGYVRSECVMSCFIQKRLKSRRVYATVLGAKTNSDGFKKEGITFPSTSDQVTLMKDVLMQTNLTPTDISYVEAHGTGTPVGDIQECDAICKMYCQKRKEPLLIGAVKSNMGHSEISSGLCSLAKALVAMETGVIPANLHVKNLDTTIPGINDNKLQIVTENTKWDGGNVAVNSFGFGGANAHMLLRSHTKKKPKDTYKSPRIRLVNVSGRTEEAVNYFLEGCEKNKDDAEFLALVDELHKLNFRGHNYRGYALLGENPERKIEKCNLNRPIWFIYTGMGSQWNGMGKDLMKFEVFRNTIQRCADALIPYKVDLISLLSNSNSTTFDDIGNCFCAIGAVEIALTDLLTSLGIVPDGIAGHSLGEVGCAYSDGNITPEQAMLLAFARGYATKNAQCVPGQMAAVGLGKEECKKLLPDDIFIACQNGSNSVTISGPKKSTVAFCEKLTAQNIFNRLVPSGQIAYHTKYVAEAGDILLQFVKGVITDPKPRSPRWISSSVPPHKKHLDWTKLNGPEYHYNNFTNPVLFDQVYEHIPSDAIIIEVAPHGLLQAILKRETSPTATHITLANRTVADNEFFFLSSIGKLYNAGGQPNLRNLYPEVTMPVSQGTTKISQFVKWDHSISWFTPLWKNEDSIGKLLEVDVSDENYSYLYGHNVDGRILMPATGYLELVWTVLAELSLKKISQLPVVFENVKFIRATVLPENDVVKFLVNIMQQSGYFEVFEGGSVCMTGRVSIAKDVKKEFVTQSTPVVTPNNYMLMKKEDLYKECHLRRYYYQGLFQGILECDVFGSYGRVEWQGKFTSFMDTMLHLSVVKETSRDLRLPIFIQQVVIDPEEHLRLVNESKAISVTYDHNANIIRAGGVEIFGLETSRAPRRVNVENNLSLETYDFITYESSKQNEYDEDTSLRIALQIVLQNLKGLIKSVRVCEVTNKDQTSNLCQNIKDILSKQPMIQAQYICTEPSNFESGHEVVVLTETLLPNIHTDVVSKGLSRDGFILYKGRFSALSTNDMNIVFQSIIGDSGIYLLRPKLELPKKEAVIHVSLIDFSWLEKVKSYTELKEPMTVYLISREDVNGLVGLLKSMLTEPYIIQFRAVILDNKSKEININSSIYQDQLKKDLTINVLKNGQWGTYVHLPFKGIKHKEVDNAAISVQIPGDLSSITWIQRPSDPVEFLPNSEIAHVFYSSLNFKDVMIATAKLQSTKGLIPTMLDMQIGFEYSGVTESGRRIMGLVPSEALSLKVRTDRHFTWEIPKSWTLEEAATVPCVYATCYYAMITRGQMRNGESILIHAGTGGIGMAAIHIALSMGCTVYTTVSTQEKRDFLKKTFPKINSANIGYSRNKTFETMVMHNTRGKGVDLVLNSLAADLFQASLRCIAKRGRFLEIGKVDFFNGTPISARMFLKNCSFHGVLLDDMMESDCPTKQEIHSLLADGIRSGVVKPLPATVFNESEVENAFRFLSSGRHKGKVLVQIRKEDATALKSPTRLISAAPRVGFDDKKSYILIGGLGGFGLELTDWMIARGAKKIVLNGRRDVSNGYQSYCLMKWSKYKGVTVIVNTDDTTHLIGADNLVKVAQKLGPLGGVFNMALVLKDGLFVNQTKSNYEEVFNAKIVSGQNMDTVTLKLSPKLDHFVVFSSVACGRGNVGQTNYAMANSALEMLCERRRRDKLPGLAVQWGPIADVGALSALNIDNPVFDLILPQKINSCIDTLEKFILQDSTIVSSLVLSEKNDRESSKITKSPAETVAHILGIKNIDIVDKTVSLTELGLDSLMLAEIKQALYRNFQLDYELEALKELTFYDLIDKGNVESQSNVADTVTGYNTAPNEIRNILLPKESILKLNVKEGGIRIPVFLVHPIEGVIEILRPLAEKLNTTVYGLQCSSEVNFEKMEDHADFFVKQLKNIQPTGPYCLCGYSFGVCVAMEMAFQLEAQNENVDLIALDGSPSYVKASLVSNYEKLDKSEAKARATILSIFAKNFKESNIDNIKQEIMKCDNWDEQLRVFSLAIAKQTGLQQLDIALSADRYYKRCLCSFYYNPNKIFHGKVLLIRSHEDLYQLPEDYGLQQLCKQPVEVAKIQGDHVSILKGKNTIEVSKIINNYNSF